MLRVVWQSEYWNYSRNDRIYFAPSSYSQNGPSLHWRHYLGDEKFLPGHQLYYGLKFGPKWDSDGETFWGGAAEFLWDITKRWQLAGEASFQNSSVYRDFLAKVGLRYRF